MRILRVFPVAAAVLARQASAGAAQEGACEDPAENDVSLLQSLFRVQDSQRDGAPSEEGARAPPTVAADESFSASQQGGRISRGVPLLVMDLDAPPELRWQNTTNHWMQMGVFPQYIHDMAKKVTDPRLMAELEALQDTMPVKDYYLREMKGILAQVGLNQSYVKYLLAAAVYYEIGGLFPQPEAIGCAGLLAAMPNGTVVHGRNMDYSGFQVEVNGKTLYYPDVTVEVIHMRGGQPLFTSVAWPGSIGIHTAMRFDGGWSFEQNTRFHSSRKALDHGLAHQSVGFVLSARRVMETTPDFETAITKLQALNLMAPSYFIVAGARPWEGAVITMDDGGGREPGTPLVRRLSSHKVGLREDGVRFEDWNIVQTNDDQNKDPLDPRRPLEQLKLAASMQSSVSAEWVQGQMLTPPLYHSGTVFTTVYIPRRNYHNTLAHFGHTR